MMRSTKRRLGGLMILVGITLLLTMLDYLPGAVFLVTFGLAFCGVYRILGGRRAYENVGFLIPGLVLLSVGSYGLLSEIIAPQWVGPGFFFLFLGAAFLGVFFVHTRTFRTADHGARYWPTYPAAGLTLFSAAILTQESLSWSWVSFQMINYLWVAVLMVVGLWLILGRCEFLTDRVMEKTDESSRRHTDGAC